MNFKTAVWCRYTSVEGKLQSSLSLPRGDVFLVLLSDQQSKILQSIIKTINDQNCYWLPFFKNWPQQCFRSTETRSFFCLPLVSVLCSHSCLPCSPCCTTQLKIIQSFMLLLLMQFMSTSWKLHMKYLLEIMLFWGNSALFYPATSGKAKPRHNTF